MALAGPGREQEQDLRPRVARDDPALVGLERDERARIGLQLLAARLDPRGPVDDVLTPQSLIVDANLASFAN